MSSVRCGECGTINDSSLLSRCSECGEPLPLQPGAYSLEQKEEPKPKEERFPPRRRPRLQRIEYEDEENDEEDGYRPARPRMRRRRRKLAVKWNEGAVILFALAGLQILVGLALIVSNANFMQGFDPKAAGALVLFVGLVLGGLGAWALFQPVLPLAIGVALYFLLTCVDFLVLANAKLQPGAGAVVFRIAIIMSLVGAAVRANERSKKD